MSNIGMSGSDADGPRKRRSGFVWLAGLCLLLLSHRHRRLLPSNQDLKESDRTPHVQNRLRQRAVKGRLIKGLLRCKESRGIRHEIAEARGPETSRVSIALAAARTHPVTDRARGTGRSEAALTESQYEPK